MGSLATLLHRAADLLVAPVDLLGAFWGVTLLSVVSTAGMLWVVAKTTPQARVERARARMASAIYEIRLFLDSPRRVFASQGRLLGSSFAYIGYMLPALIILSLPVWLMYLHIEARLGVDPVPVGAPFLVRVDLADGVDGTKVAAAPSQDGLEVTAPPLYDRETHRVYLRAVAPEPGDLSLALDIDGRTVEKRIVAGPSADTVSPERASGLALLDTITTEPALDPDTDGAVAIAIDHPDRRQVWLGLDIPWWAYSLILITIFAVLLARPMNVKL